MVADTSHNVTSVAQTAPAGTPSPATSMGRLPRRDEIEGWMVGEDAANCVLLGWSRRSNFHISSRSD